MTALLLFVVAAAGDLQESGLPVRTVEVSFKSHDGYPMRGKLTLPGTPGDHAVVIYVQTAEGMTVDMKRPLGAGKTFNYFDIYRSKFTEMDVAFFSYEGRGVAMGDDPPRYEAIDREVYDTSTLDNKVSDAVSALQAAKAQNGVDPSRIFLMGASEGSLLAAEAAARVPDDVAGLVLYGLMASNMRYTFAYIMSDGAFITYRRAFDTDKDGRVSKAEFEADPRTYRKNVLKGAEFSVFDKDQDGFFTVEDMKVLTKVYLDAIDNENFAVLEAWAVAGAAVSIPKGWFQDHFAHGSMWSFLSVLDVPVGCFHGSNDAFVPIEGVKLLQAKAKHSGKEKMEFFYFDGLDHSLGVGEYFVKGTVPAGHAAIFEFVRRVAGRS